MYMQWFSRERSDFGERVRDNQAVRPWWSAKIRSTSSLMRHVTFKSGQMPY